MTDRERILKTIGFDTPDYVPCFCGLTSRMRDALFSYPGGRSLYERFGSPIVCTDFSLPQIQIKPGYDRDYFGVVWNKTGVDKDIGVIDSLLIEDPDALKDYAFPPVPEDFIRRQCKWLEENKGDRFSVGMLGFSLFERAWTLCGMENLLCYMITDPDFADALLDKICDYNLEIIRISGDYAFDGFYFGDDWGQQRGLIMGPTHWRRFIRPRLEKMYRAVREQGRVVIQHSCGDIREILDDVINLGLNVYQTFQPEIYDIPTYQKLLKGRLTIWGSISTQKELPCLTPSEIADLTKTRMKLFREGGLICAPTHDVPGDVPPENLMAMLAAMMEEQGRIL